LSPLLLGIIRSNSRGGAQAWLEGIVGKRIDSVYEPGERSGAWLKLRTNLEQEFVIGGYIPGARGFDALLIGVYEKKDLNFVAKVKNGPRIRDELLRPLRRCKLPPTTSAAQQMFLSDTK
jgi:bifunctional non-homologous end joining protein LigD